MSLRWRQLVCAAVLGGSAAAGTMLGLCLPWGGQESTDGLRHAEAVEILLRADDPRQGAAILVLHLDAAVYVERLKAIASDEGPHAERARAFLDDLERRIRRPR